MKYGQNSPYYKQGKPKCMPFFISLNKIENQGSGLKIIN